MQQEVHHEVLLLGACSQSSEGLAKSRKDPAPDHSAYVNKYSKKDNLSSSEVIWHVVSLVSPLVSVNSFS